MMQVHIICLTQTQKHDGFHHQCMLCSHYCHLHEAADYLPSIDLCCHEQPHAVLLPASDSPCFQVTFGPDSKTITKMNSIEGEGVKFDEPVEVGEVVEQWLNDLCDAMKTSLGSQLTTMMGGKGTSDAGQIMCLHDAVRWTQG
jgi:Dynein heavy chain, N-terminal region 2